MRPPWALPGSDTAALEQRQAIEGVSRAVEQSNQDMEGMVRGVQSLSDATREIHDDARSLMGISAATPEPDA